MVKAAPVRKKAATGKKRSPASAGIAAPAKKKGSLPAGKRPVKQGLSAGENRKKIGKTGGRKTPVRPTGKVVRYRCRLCGYIYSPLRGEPHHGIPADTRFEDLPEDYVCPVCGQQGKGRIGKWGFEEWHPTRYLCTMCNYVYDEKRGEPHRGIKPGTKFEDLPDDYVCPVCALDPHMVIRFGKVFKNGFEPLNL